MGCVVCFLCLFVVVVCFRVHNFFVGLCGWLGFVFWFGSAVCSGCASCHKQPQVSAWWSWLSLVAMAYYGRGSAEIMYLVRELGRL